MVETLEAKYNFLVGLFHLLVWPHEVEQWFHSWYRGSYKEETLKYNLIFT